MQKADEVSGQGDKIVNHHSHQTHAPVDYYHYHYHNNNNNYYYYYYYLSLIHI